MKLGEKIYALRKRLGLSQEDLASALNVSRQSISNWETGGANPEISKLPSLAETLGVSVDFLLDESRDLADFDQDNSSRQRDEKDESPNEHAEDIQASTNKAGYPSWLDGLPKFFKNGIYRYGWLYGIRLAVSGLAFVVFGLIGKAMFGGFFREIASPDFGGPGFNSPVVETSENLPPEVLQQIHGQLGYSAPGSSFMNIIPNAALIIGIILIIVGLIAAYALKQWGKRQQDEK